MSWWRILSAVSTVSATFIAIGYVSYTIYEAYMREKKHSYGGNRKDNRSKPSNFASYEDMKKEQDGDLRRRNVRNEGIEDEKKSVVKKSVPVSDPGTQMVASDLPGFTVPTNENYTLDNDGIVSVSSSFTFDGTESTCDSLAIIETITSDIDQDLLAHSKSTWIEMSDADIRYRNVRIEDEKKSVVNQGVPVSDPGTQMGAFDLPGFTVPTNENYTLNNDDIVSVSSSITFDGTESTCDSLASIETITSDIDQDLLAHSISTWIEMSDADRNLSICRSCDEAQVSTVTIPCEHAYLCNECAPILKKRYSRCIHCKTRISGYQSIDNL